MLTTHAPNLPSVVPPGANLTHNLGYGAQVGLAVRQEGTVVLYGLLAGPTAQIRTVDFFIGGKILQGKQLVGLLSLF